MISQNSTWSQQLSKTVTFFMFLTVCISLLTSCESRNTIVNGLDEKEANEIVVFLSTKGIEVTKVKNAEGGGGGGAKIALYDISVPNEQVTEAMSILNQSGLPRRRGQSLLGIFSDGGLVPSEMQEKIRYQAGLAAQIASTIRKIDGVLDAEVQISFPEDDPLNPGKQKGDITASVYVKHSGVLDDPNSHLITKLKRLLTASITGLKYDNVTVISDRARFSDFAIGLQGSRDDEKEFVSVWTIIIAKESLMRFRIIFFSFSLVVLFLTLAFIWIGWKVFPIINQHGGLSALFSLQPIKASDKPNKDEKDKDGDEEDENEENEDEEDEDEVAEEEEDEEPPTDVT